MFALTKSSQFLNTWQDHDDYVADIDDIDEDVDDGDHDGDNDEYDAYGLSAPYDQNEERLQEFEFQSKMIIISLSLFKYDSTFENDSYILSIVPRTVIFMLRDMKFDQYEWEG